MSVSRWRPWPLLLLGLAAAVVLFALAQPTRVFALAGRAHSTELAAAFALTAAVATLRGLRLRVVVGSSLGIWQALGVQAVSQFAISVLPLRLGEVAILPLLHRAGVKGVVRGLSAVLTVRFLDLAALLTWLAAAGAWVGISGAPAAFALVVVALGVGVTALAGQRLLAFVARRLRHASPRWRRGLRQVLRARGELKRLAATPGRAIAAAFLSLAAWGGVWWLTVLLLRAMDISWPAATVLWGTLGATAGAALPVNAVGNFGTLEAGWTAALTALGVPAGQALAAGFATHAWSLLFNAGLAAAGAPLALRDNRAGRAAPQATPKARRNL